MVLSNSKCMQIRLQISRILFQGLQVQYSTFHLNRIKIQVIQLILQLETDYFSSLFISEMFHSKQWNYSCQQRLPAALLLILHKEIHSSIILHEEVHEDSSILHITRGFPIQKLILHSEDRELFEYYYYIQRAKRPSFQKRHSTSRKQGALRLQDLPEVFQAFQLQDLTRAFQTFTSFQTFQSFMTFQPSRHYYTFQYFQYLPVFPVLPVPSSVSSASRDSTPLQLYSILQLECKFYTPIGFHRKLH